VLWRYYVSILNDAFTNVTMHREYLWDQLKLSKINLSDTVTEKDSEKSIQKSGNDIFVEINEKLSAVFNISGFAIYIKINGMILIKNYVHNRLNLRL
jgi:hypothetical protein